MLTLVSGEQIPPQENSIYDHQQLSHALGPVWFFRRLLKFRSYQMFDTWSIKYRLIMKLIAQLTINLRDESFKPN